MNDTLVRPRLHPIVWVVLLSAVGQAFAAAQNRIVRPVDPARRVTLRSRVPRGALPRDDRGPVSGSMRLPYLTLQLKPAAGLEQFLAEQRTPSSPNYHRWL